MKKALLLFCHGARDPNWAKPFEAVLARIRALHPDTPVALAFLEFMSPGLIEAGHTLAAAGCDSVEVVPLFLGTGGHVRKDLPALLDTLRLAHPQMSWSVQPSIGESPCVIAAMADAALAAMQTPQPST
jgi:sirohydrochlorin cobaltochelatase